MTNVVTLSSRKRKPPTTVNGKVPPKRARNADRRAREYLTPEEVGRLIDHAGRVGRHGQRDGALPTLAYRHGLRVLELVALRWDMVDLKQGLLHVNRLKNGIASVHPLRGPELRALRKLSRDYPETPYVFVTERKGPLTPDTVRKLIARAGDAAGLGFPVHPHMLRHAGGWRRRFRDPNRSPYRGSRRSRSCASLRIRGSCASRSAPRAPSATSTAGCVSPS